MVKVNFISEGIIAIVNKGETILEAARKAGVIIEAPCNAMGTCGKCKVKVVSKEIQDSYVLACQAQVYEDIEVITENAASQNKTLRILSDGRSFSYDIKSNITKCFDGEKTRVSADGAIIGEEPGDTSLQAYGLSIDIGTTTLVTALINLLTGEEIASVSALNPQSLQAQDVLTRIKFASSPEGLEIMYNSITGELNRMIEDVSKEAKIDRQHIYEAVYSGNTTMIHLACNIDPAALGKYPYTSQISGGNNISAAMLNISPFGLIYLPPVISAYVGPDITSGILASQLNKSKGITLFIDIGTNGEMVIAKEGRLSATSTAAGPAFEGMNIAYGMRAGKGALEYFKIEDSGEIKTHAIGDVKATGICGSGLLDIVGELVKAQVIGASGRFAAPEKGTYSENIKKQMAIKDGKLCFEAAPQVFLTLKDIRQVQLAKGAIRTGVEMLLRSLNVKAEEVDSVEIAGAFGFHLREESLLNIGMLPKEFKGKISFVGNTSKTGGEAFLLNTDFRRSMDSLVKEIEVIDLADQKDFDKIFVKELSF
ncbi:MAG: ASKHA domain-containing protein [Clostridiaceae bacterium]|nr:ASKHA domain-containing protein [Clostridiaceae bacterium]